MNTWNQRTHVVGKAYDLTQDNFNAVIRTVEELFVRLASLDEQLLWSLKNEAQYKKELQNVFAEATASKKMALEQQERYRVAMNESKALVERLSATQREHAIWEKSSLVQLTQENARLTEERREMAKQHQEDARLWQIERGRLTECASAEHERFRQAQLRWDEERNHLREVLSDCEAFLATGCTDGESEHVDLWRRVTDALIRTKQLNAASVSDADGRQEKHACSPDGLATKSVGCNPHAASIESTEVQFGRCFCCGGWRGVVRLAMDDSESESSDG
jgi:hypothetical protein